MGTSLWSILAVYVPGIAVAVMGVFYGIGVAKNRKDIDTINDNGKWETALNIRNVEIADLKAQILDQAKRYDATVVSLQTQITALTVQVKALTEKNEVLQNTVSGRDLLDIVIADQKKLAEALAKFDVLLDTDGILNQFMENDAKIIAGIEDIKGVLALTHRKHDAIVQTAANK